MDELKRRIKQNIKTQKTAHRFGEPSRFYSSDSIKEYYSSELTVDIPGIVSSRTSSTILTVSRDVNIVTPF